MSTQRSSALVVLAVVLVIVGFAEHLFFRVELIPHLAVVLGAVAVVISVYGLVRRSVA